MSFRAQGMRAWLLQRLTAVYIAVYLLVLLLWLVNVPSLNFETWREYFSSNIVIIASILFYTSVFIHAWVGMRDIFVDYIKPSSLRFIMLTGLAIFLSVQSLWLLIIVVRLIK